MIALYVAELAIIAAAVAAVPWLKREGEASWRAHRRWLNAMRMMRWGHHVAAAMVGLGVSLNDAMLRIHRAMTTPVDRPLALGEINILASKLVPPGRVFMLSGLADMATTKLRIREDVWGPTPCGFTDYAALERRRALAFLEDLLDDLAVRNGLDSDDAWRRPRLAERRAAALERDRILLRARHAYGPMHPTVAGGAAAIIKGITTS